MTLTPEGAQSAHDDVERANLCCKTELWATAAVYLRNALTLVLTRGYEDNLTKRLRDAITLLDAGRGKEAMAKWGTLKALMSTCVSLAKHNVRRKRTPHTRS